MEKDLVFIENKQALTSSLTVAEYFEKRHDIVVRDIRTLIEQMASVSQPSIPRNAMFTETSYQAEECGRRYPLYLMNRDGFTLLAMGFTGQRALKFKLDFIDAFNRMEAKLSAPEFALPVSDFERGKELSKLVPFAKDFFTQSRLIAKTANLLLGEHFLPIPTRTNDLQIALF